jgi:hypothetical protein
MKIFIHSQRGREGSASKRETGEHSSNFYWMDFGRLSLELLQARSLTFWAATESAHMFVLSQKTQQTCFSSGANVKTFFEIDPLGPPLSLVMISEHYHSPQLVVTIEYENDTEFSLSPEVEKDWREYLSLQREKVSKTPLENPVLSLEIASNGQEVPRLAPISGSMFSAMIKEKKRIEEETWQKHLETEASFKAQNHIKLEPNVFSISLPEEDEN